jgi:hypothetical protein
MKLTADFVRLSRYNDKFYIPGTHPWLDDMINRSAYVIMSRTNTIGNEQIHKLRLEFPELDDEAAWSFLDLALSRVLEDKGYG